MTKEQIKDYKTAAELGLIPDGENPIFLFSQIHKDLLVEIVAGRIDAMQLARHELRCRGLDDAGRFVGFNQKNIFDEPAKSIR